MGDAPYYHGHFRRGRGNVPGIVRGGIGGGGTGGAMRQNKGMYRRTGQSDEYNTPQAIFDVLHAEYNFTLDGAAKSENAKLPKYCTDACADEWQGERVFCNPPYSNIMPFVELAKETRIAVLLLPVYTDKEWFHELVRIKATLRFFRKRISFNGKQPRFTSMIAIIKGTPPSQDAPGTQ